MEYRWGIIFDTHTRPYFIWDNMNKIIKIIRTISQSTLIRYGIGGGLAACIDLWILYSCTDLFWLYYVYSQIIAFSISFSFSYFFQKFLTFRNYDSNHFKQWTKFLMFAVSGLGLNLLIMYILVDYLHIHYMISSMIGKGVVFFRNYSMNFYFNFS